MAWDQTYNLLWSSRVATEEKAFLEANRSHPALLSLAESSGRPADRGRTGGSALSQAGASTVSQLPKTGRSRGSTAMSTSASEGALASIPAHLAPLARFPVADRDLLSARVVKTADGKTPTIRFKKEIVEVTWGSGHIVTYKPEFVLEDPPDWQPEDILRHRPGGRRRRAASSGASASAAPGSGRR
ncbi:unnamed protein product [Prorocentrum cordatum]|uniref:Uncharacterized protein n=1 Tax=Prorocentrum cordatum TaxID=2364126 RepID=A0ABN9T464_9DINO|nr:unnamed protein product [Polarella glacialis]